MRREKTNDRSQLDKDNHFLSDASTNGSISSKHSHYGFSKSSDILHVGWVEKDRNMSDNYANMSRVKSTQHHTNLIENNLRIDHDTLPIKKRKYLGLDENNLTAMKKMKL